MVNLDNMDIMDNTDNMDNKLMGNMVIMGLGSIEIWAWFLIP